MFSKLELLINLFKDLLDDIATFLSTTLVYSSITALDSKDFAKSTLNFSPLDKT